MTEYFITEISRCYLLLFGWFFLHSPIEPSSVLLPIKELGYGGVDIFIFASGIGCFYSLNKNNDIKLFFKRRLAKIMPMWLLFLAIYFIYQNTVSTMTLREIFGNIFGIGFFANLKHQFNWYIGAMWACYLSAPLFFSFLTKTNTSKKVLMIFALICISTLFFNQDVLLFWSRLPIFFIGMTAAEISTRKDYLTLKQIIFILLTMISGAAILCVCYIFFADYLWNYGLHWYPFILITPGMTLTISLTADFLSKTKLKCFINFLSNLGNHTFSIYISHIFVFEVYSYLCGKNIIEKSTVNYLISVFAILIFAIILHFATKGIIKIYSSIKARKKETLS